MDTKKSGPPAPKKTARDVLRMVHSAQIMLNIRGGRVPRLKEWRGVVDAAHAVLDAPDTEDTLRGRLLEEQGKHAETHTKYRTLRIAADRTRDALRIALSDFDRTRQLDKRVFETLLRADRLDVLVQLLHEQRDMARASREHAETKTTVLVETMKVEDAERPLTMSCAAASPEPPPFWRAWKDKHGATSDFPSAEQHTIRQSMHTRMTQLLHAATRVEIGRDGSVRVTLPASWAMREAIGTLADALASLGIMFSDAAKASR